MSTASFTSKDGTRIACYKSGSGPPLVLVHGTSADHSRWTPVLPALGEHFTVYACDRRGRGGSDDATATYAIEREFEDVAAIVDGIGGPVDLLGHSWGALCSIEASALARNLHRLIAYEPPISTGVPIYAPEMIERLQAMLDAGDRDGVAATFLGEVARVPPDQLTLLRSLPVWQGRVAASHTIVRELRVHQTYVFAPEKLRQVKVPTLLLLGGASPAFFKAAIECVHDALPQSKVVVMPNQQHVAMDTCRDIFLGAVLSFLLKDR